MLLQLAKLQQQAMCRKQLPKQHQKQQLCSVTVAPHRSTVTALSALHALRETMEQSRTALLLTAVTPGLRMEK